MAADEKPKFDFSNITRRWGKAWMRCQADQVKMAGQEIPDGGDLAEMSDAEKAKAQKMVSDVFDTVERVIVTQERLIAQVLVDVPRSWLGHDAPEGLDWSDPESLDYVLDARFAELVQAVNEARSAKN